jgi:PAS domain S-box-containing protein
MKILIADDHELVRKGVRSVLGKRADFEICGDAVDGRDAIQKAQALNPDVIVMDISMPNLNGLDATRELRRILPDIKVVVLTQHDSREMMRQALNAGARGYVVKSGISADLVSALDQVRVGQLFFDAAASKKEIVNPDLQEILQRSAAFESALQESEERFRLTFEHAAVGICHVAADGRWLRVNQRQCEIVGYTQEELQKLRFQDITYPPDLGADLEQAAKVVSGEIDHYTMEKRYVRKDGSLTWINLTVAGMRDASRNFKYFISVVEDINARKQAEEALRDSENRLRAIIEGTPECVKLVDRDGTLLHMNAAGLAALGAESAEMVVGKELWSLIAPEDREDYRKFNERICRGEKGTLEFDIIGLTGIRRHMETHAVPLIQPDGSIIQLAVSRDITNRRQSDQATSLLAAIVDSSDDAIVSKNLDGVITSWNKGAVRLFGYSAEEAVGQHISLIIPTDRQGEEVDILARLRRGERIDHFETIRRRKDGTLRNISVTISPIKDASGRVIGASKVARDITETKRAQEALQQSEERLRVLSERLETEVRERTGELQQRNADILRQAEQVRQLSWQLLTTQDEERRHIARELHDSAGQILTVLGMSLATLVQNTKEKAPEIAESAKDARELAQQLTKEIRTTSYLLHPPLLEESGLPAALSWYIRGLIERSGLDIDFTISKEFGRLPREMELVVFRCVQECLTNIHRHSGSKNAVIKIIRDSERVLIEVRDHGKGISAERLAAINSNGVGVGIRGMRERLRQFAGEMVIDSSPAGTTVMVTIPLAKDEAASKQSSVAAPILLDDPPS